MVFSRVSEASRLKNRAMLQTLMWTPFGEQIRPFFVTSAPHPSLLLLPEGDSDSVQFFFHQNQNGLECRGCRLICLNGLV